MSNTSQQKKFLAINYSGNHATAISSISLSVGGVPTVLEIPLPIEKVPAEYMIPLFQVLTNFLVDMSVNAIEKEGKTISCKKGCGACCSQLVPITELEVGYLQKVVSEMPESQQAIIHEKFKQATQQLEQAKILEKLRRPQNLNKEQRIQLGLDYFQLNIPCPFLEEQSCSIHQHRPMACREYLVTSPVEYCSTPDSGEIKGIEMPRKISHAVTMFTKKKKGSASWFPLILVTEPQHKTDNKQQLLNGTDWLKRVFAKLS